MKGAAKLQALVTPDAQGRRSLVTVPGCWDPISALLIQEAGLSAGFVSGAAVSMTRFGLRDDGYIGLSDIVDVVARITQRVDLPLIVDVDTGFGNDANLAHAVRRLEHAGAAAVQVEDQVFPKRCGHDAGKAVIPLGEAADKIKAAVDARDQALIVARTDALSIHGLDDAMARAEAFLVAGADWIFIEGPPTAHDMTAIAERFATRVPLVHNMVEGGVNGLPHGPDVARLGFAVTLHPLTILLAGLTPQRAALAHVRRHQDTMALADLGTRHDLNALVG